MGAAKRKWLWSMLICISVLVGGLLPQNHLYASVNASGGSPSEEARIQERERKERLARFEMAAEELYRNMQEVNPQAALQNMELLTDSLEGLSFKGLTSVEGIHALAESIMEVRETLVNVRISREEWSESSARLRLAVNSLTHKDKALWLQYYKVMTDDLDNMEKGRAQGSQTLVRESFLSLKSHYEVIRPAAVIRRDASGINRFDTWMSYADRLSGENTMDEKALGAALDQADGLLKELFGRRADEPVFFPITGYGDPWNWGLLIGGWIVLALAYAGLRKYRADQAVTSVHGKKDRADSYRF